jgi:diguanylate cyclase (GGDEF)-like protein
MPTPVPSARPADLLIASNQEWTGRSLASILAPHGYVVRMTYTRAQAVARIRTDPPDAVIIDEELPDADGFALSRELYEDGLISPSTPVFLTVPRSPTRRDRLAAMGVGAWACLGEPLDAEELVASLGVFVPAKIDADQARSNGLIDEVTGVYNVRGLTRRAQELGAHATRRHLALGCVVLAADTEPAAGPEAGPDAPLDLLWRIAATLRAATRDSDVIGRLTSGAFAVVAMDTDAAQARRLAERLAAAILDAPGGGAAATPRFRLRAGCHGVPDFNLAAIDSAELMLRATTALQKARTDQPDAWLQQYNDSSAEF